MFERPSDFRYGYAHNRWELSYREDDKWVLVSGFKTIEEVKQAIDNLTHPEKIKRPVYSSECQCLTKQWRYYEENEEGIVFQLCTICNKPLSIDIVNHFNKDFDLSKFIAGEY